MAVPIYTTDLTVYNDCTDATGWVELIGMALSARPATDTDLAILGNTCITSNRAKVGLSSNVFVGAGFTLAVGECIFLWHKFFAPNSLAPIADGGVRVMVGDSSTVYDGYYVDGSDTVPYGEWRNYVVDPTTTPDQSAGTTTGTYAMVGNGWNLPLQAPFKGNPFATDSIVYGRGISEFIEGDITTPATFFGYSLVNDDILTGRWGLVQAQKGGYLFKGLAHLGTDTTPVYMSDSNVNLTIDDVSKVTASFNGFEIRNVASVVKWKKVNITSLSTVSRGYFKMVDNAIHEPDDCVFTDMGTFEYLSNAVPIKITHSRCDLVTQGGATMVDGYINNPNGPIGILIDNLNIITGYTFISTGSNYGADLGTVATISYNWNNKEEGHVIGVAGTDVGVTPTGNETLLVSVNAGEVLTISVASGASTPSVANSGLGTVDVIAGLLLISFIVKSKITGLGIPDANITIQRKDTKATILIGTTDVNGLYSESIAATYTDIDYVGWIRQMDLIGIDYVSLDIQGTITSTGASISISLEIQD